MRPAPSNDRGKKSKYRPHQGAQECARRALRDTAPYEPQEPAEVYTKEFLDKKESPLSTTTPGEQDNA